MIFRKGYGLGAMAMAGGGFDRPAFCCAWPSGEVGAMGLEGAVKLGARDHLAGIADAAEREYTEKFVASLARRDPAMRPLGAICKQHCGEEIGACMLEGLRLIGGYGELMPLDTPYEGLIGQTPFSISKKAENNLRRLIRARGGAAKGEPLNQCLGQSVGG